MAHMHSRKRGKSKSHKPINPTTPTWMRHTEKEVELLVTKLAKDGKKTAEIGIILRDSYGIPSVKLITHKRVGEILVEKKLSPQLPEDLFNLMRRSVLLRKHLDKNKHDQTAVRGLHLTESKILRLAKYYQREGKIVADWKYSPDEIALVVAG